jgi:hypothetical protein
LRYPIASVNLKCLGEEADEELGFFASAIPPNPHEADTPGKKCHDHRSNDER